MDSEKRRRSYKDIDVVTFSCIVVASECYTGSNEDNMSREHITHKLMTKGRV